MPNTYHYLPIALLGIIAECVAISLGFASSPNQQKLLAPDGNPNDFFGYSVAITENTALVGAMKSDSGNGEDVGSAYVYTRTHEGWKLQAELTADDGRPGDTLGGNVAIFENIAVLGSIGVDEKGENAGAAYVLQQNNSKWKQIAKLQSSDAAAGDAFGQCVSVSNNTIVIGAPHDDDKGESSGSVYIFNLEANQWHQKAKLTAPDGHKGDVFGISVALEGDTLLIGADLNDESATDGGATYVFTRSDNDWTFEAKLMADDAGATDIFGVRVALSGDTALISARRDDDENMGIDSGSAYVFVRDGDSWHQQAKLTASDGSADDRFGRGVAISGDIAIISAMHQDDNGENSGAAYLFVREGNQWIEKQKITAKDGAAGDLFGWNIALHSKFALVGTPRDDNKGEESGAAYIIDFANWSIDTKSAVKNRQSD